MCSGSVGLGPSGLGELRQSRHCEACLRGARICAVGQARFVTLGCGRVCPATVWHGKAGEVRQCRSCCGPVRCGMLRQASFGRLGRGSVSWVTVCHGRHVKARQAKVWHGMPGIGRQGELSCGTVVLGNVWQARLVRVVSGGAWHASAMYGDVRQARKERRMKNE